MKLFSLAALAGLASADFYTISIHAPHSAHLNAQVVNAQGRAFVVGASAPSTHCGMRNPQQCPAGAATLVNADMSLLAAAVPGGQAIHVLLDGSITYSPAHSGSRPPSAQSGSFHASHAGGQAVLTWRSGAGPAGLFVCPGEVLKAATLAFWGDGCVPVAGLRVEAAGSAFGAWEYT